MNKITMEDLKTFSQSPAVNSLKGALSRWAQRNVDFAFFLAAFTETPRWTIAFMAIHEPMWVGVPLGVLLAFATAKAWRKFFVSRDWRLFWFNVASIAIAVLVIAPVLFAQVSDHNVDLTKVLEPWMLWCWSVVLALTTFIPLVQLAACDDAQVKTQEKNSAGPNFDIHVVVAQAVQAHLSTLPQLTVKPEAPAIIEPKLKGAVMDTTTTSKEVVKDESNADEDTAQLDDLDADIINAVNGGADTVYAISKAVNKPSTTLRRKDGSGRLPKLVVRGYIREVEGKYQPAITVAFPIQETFLNGAD